MSRWPPFGWLSGEAPAAGRLLSVLAGIAITTVLAFTVLIALTPSQTSVASSPVSATPAPETGDGSNQECLQCHGANPAPVTFPNGDSLDVSISGADYSQSVHGEWLDCVDCHQSNRRYPHPLPEVSSRRDYSLAEYELCKRCHLENYTKTMDSIHNAALSQGKTNAPICTDCHKPHTMKPVGEDRTQIPKVCASCHKDVYAKYATSVHAAGLAEQNPDVPDCVTCHGVHNIGAAKTSSFRQASVDLCAKCHANEKMMSKYKISSDVLKTYLDDFHGKTVGFYQKQSSEIWPDVAVCTDCHGVHDIKPVDDPQSSVIKANLQSVCKKCHKDASANFPSAWLSHYQPSLSDAPMVYFVKRYYQVLIPIMVVGLMLNVALDLWRLARNR